MSTLNFADIDRVVLHEGEVQRIDVGGEMLWHRLYKPIIGIYSNTAYCTVYQLESTYNTFEAEMVAEAVSVQPSSGVVYAIYFAVDPWDGGKYVGSDVNFNWFIGIAAATQNSRVKATVKSVWTRNRQTLYVNGTLITYRSISALSSGRIFVGRCESTRQGEFNLYRLKLSLDGSLIHDYIPVKRRADGVVGLFDVYGNGGFVSPASGSFIEITS